MAQTSCYFKSFLLLSIVRKFDEHSICSKKRIGIQKGMKNYDGQTFPHEQNFQLIHYETRSNSPWRGGRGGGGVA